jgi:hypothetical protein
MKRLMRQEREASAATITELKRLNTEKEVNLMALQRNLDACEAASVKQVCPDVPSGHFILKEWKPDTQVEAKLAKLSRAMQDNPFCGAARQAACADIMVIRNDQRDKYLDAQADVERCYNDIEVTNNLTSHRCETSQRLMDNNISQCFEAQSCCGPPRSPTRSSLIFA